MLNRILANQKLILRNQRIIIHNQNQINDILGFQTMFIFGFGVFNTLHIINQN